MRSWNRWLLYLVIAAPAIFLLIAVERSGITVPFWDNCELIRVVSGYMDGHLSIPSLWAPHNHSRPLTYRVLYLAHAALTRWDVRSEFAIHLATIFAAFGLQIAALWRLTGRKVDTRFLVWAGLLSIFAFSPVGHNNHWWSFMSVLTLCHLFVLYALIEISFDPESWRGNLQAAIACWLATYSMTNGLIAFVCCVGISQFASDRPWRPSRWTLFWAANLLAVAWLYFPGLPHESASKPGLLQFVWFSIVYLGIPFRGLLQFRYHDCLHLPGNTVGGGVVGLLLLAFAGMLLYAHREQLRLRTPAALIAVSFLSFAILSAAMTAWGRANFDENGVSNANASRYTLFGSYFSVGLLLFLASLGRDAIRAPLFTRLIPVRIQPAMTWAAYGLFLILATSSYAKSIKVYRSAAELNSRVVNAYLADPSDALLDSSIYPNAEFAAQLKRDMQRLHLGPFREQIARSPADSVVFTSGCEQPSPELIQRAMSATFTCPVDAVTSIDVILYTYMRENSGFCQLDVVDASGNRLDSSRVEAAALIDGAYQAFAFKDLADERGRTLRLELTYHADPHSPGTIAVLSTQKSRETFRFRVRGKNDAAAELARQRNPDRR